MNQRDPIAAVNDNEMPTDLANSMSKIDWLGEIWLENREKLCLRQGPPCKHGPCKDDHCKLFVGLASETADICLHSTIKGVHSRR